MVNTPGALESYALVASLFLPFFGTLLCLAAGSLASNSSEVPARWPGRLAATLAAMSLTLSVFAALATRHNGVLDLLGPEWIPGFGPAISLHLDWLSSWLLLLVEIIGLMVIWFSLGYMKEERDQRRFFGGLLFFIAMMKLLVLAGSYLLMFAGWEGVGLASYLLIGYHFERPRAAHAATKAFVVNRVGDAGFILGTIAFACWCGSTNFAPVFSKAAHLPHSALLFIGSMLAIAAVGKSAQFPLHIWLPDAMEGPTPVSALIHSATMVCAGVYLLARSSALLLLAPEVGLAISVLGVVTALFGASVALAENDIKRVLAYSTISQIGFMFMALGVGAARVGMFHVVTHAFFKALLFLGAGSVIHALHGEQNLDHMGGLRARLPLTFWTMCIGALTLAGIPGLSAFFSKDLILESVFHSSHWLMGLAGVVTSGLTAVYAWRLLSLIFFRETRTHQLPAHEGPRSMRIPLMVLTGCCVLVGCLFVPVHWAAWRTMSVSAIVALGGVAVAAYFYVVNPGARTLLDNRFAALAHLLRNRWFVDAVFEEYFTERIVFRTAEGAAAADTWLLNRGVDAVASGSRQLGFASGWFDRNAIDGTVRLLSNVARLSSWPFRAVQNGFVQTYVFLFIAGAIAALGFCFVR